MLLSLQAMLISVGTWMFFNWMPLYFRESFGLSLAVAGFSGTAVLQLSAVLGALVGGTLSDQAAKFGIVALQAAKGVAPRSWAASSRVGSNPARRALRVSAA